MGRPVARYSAAVSVLSKNRLSSLTHNVKLDLLPNERLESLWDALWLGIRPFFVLSKNRLSSLNHDVKFDLLPNERVKTFWDVPWLGIRPFYCCVLEPSVFAYPRCKIIFATE